MTPKDIMSGTGLRVIKGGKARSLDADTKNAAQNDLLQAVRIAAQWLALPANRRATIMRLLAVETDNARSRGEKSPLYTEDDGLFDKYSPYHDAHIMRYYAQLQPDGKCVAAFHIIEEHRRVYGADVRNAERWIDSLLINERYP